MGLLLQGSYVIIVVVKLFCERVDAACYLFLAKDVRILVSGLVGGLDILLLVLILF